MARWEPDAAGRLREAALELYVDRGYEQTTVAEIAERAGVTARTFFRHYDDKREVLFAGSQRLEHAMLEALTEVDPAADPLTALGASLDAAAGLIGVDQRFSRRRAAVISANPELLERELIKMARLADALTSGLVRRDVPEPDARLVAEAAVAVFRVGFERWVAGPRTGDLAVVLRDALGQLRTLVG